MSPDWHDALCPGCAKPPTRLGGVGGWLFVCEPCGMRWGHPQVSYGEGGASGLLHDARETWRPDDDNALERGR